MSTARPFQSTHANRDLPNRAADRTGLGSSHLAREGAVTAALQRRLEQLQTAMGETPTSPPSAGSAPAPWPHTAGESETANPARATSTRRRALILLLPVLGIAYWWALTHNNTPLHSPIPASPALTAPTEASAPATAPTVPEPVTVTAVEQQLRERVESWRKAWAARDIEAYLAHYSASFEAANGLSRLDWETNRRRILARPATIVLNIHSLELRPMSADRWAVRFRQDYAAGSFVEKNLDKSLELQREGDQWLIVSERQLVETELPTRP